jgi:hypothetical protein
MDPGEAGCVPIWSGLAALQDNCEQLSYDFVGPGELAACADQDKMEGTFRSA